MNLDSKKNSSPSTVQAGSSVPPGRERFATTSWSMVVHAADPDSPGKEDALSALCETYWYPLYVFVRRKGHARAEAEDLTQAFFAELLAKNTISIADGSRGKFRTFLLTALTHFMANDWRSRQTEKRGGRVNRISIDYDAAENRLSSQPVHELTPEKIFDRAWALTLLEEAIEAVRDQYRKSGKLELFEALRGALVGEETATHQEIASRLNMTESAIKVSLYRLRQRYGDQLRLQIARTLDDPSCVDEELSALYTALS